MPVLGFSLDALVGVGGELSPTGLDLVGDMEGNPTLACGGALEAAEVERAVACGWRSPCEGNGQIVSLNFRVGHWLLVGLRSRARSSAEFVLAKPRF